MAAFDFSKFLNISSFKVLKEASMSPAQVAQVESITVLPSNYEGKFLCELALKSGAKYRTSLGREVSKIAAVGDRLDPSTVRQVYICKEGDDPSVETNVKMVIEGEILR